MSTKQIAMLKRLASDNELDLREYPDGKITVIGGLMPVHWWPTSKKMTAYIDGAPRGYPYCSAKNIIQLALSGERGGEK